MDLKNNFVNGPSIGIEIQTSQYKVHLSKPANMNNKYNNKDIATSKYLDLVIDSYDKNT